MTATLTPEELHEARVIRERISAYFRQAATWLNTLAALEHDGNHTEAAQLALDMSNAYTPPRVEPYG